MAGTYHFITRWRVKGTAEEVFQILSAPLEYPRWWPSVYLRVREVAPDSVSLLTRGWLPYTLQWQAVTAETSVPHRIAIQATGDLDGRGIWSIVQDGAFTDATFDWRLNVRRKLLRFLSPLFRPALEANHHWAMEQGRKSLELELARHRAATVEEMNTVPAPTGPKGLWGSGLAGGVVVTAGVAAGLIGGLLKNHAAPAPRAARQS